MDYNSERRRFKAKRDFLASRAILRANIKLFDEGCGEVYRVVAVELRKLLCDGKASLLPRLFPGMRLHPAQLYRPNEDLTGLAFQFPVDMYFDGSGGVKVDEVFDKRRLPIPLDEWIHQPFLSRKITLHEFIRSVADKESAHADEDFTKHFL